MAVYVDEDFDEFPLGYGSVPTGWNVNGPPMEIRAFTDGGQYSVAIPDQYYYGQATLTTPGMAELPNAVTLWIGYRPDLFGSSFGILQFNLINNDDGAVGVIRLTNERNNSLSLYTGNQLIANSSQPDQSGFIFSYDTWYYINFTVMVTPLDNGNVAVSGDVSFNGGEVVKNIEPVDTGIPLTNIPTLGIWSLTFESAFLSFSSYSRVVIEDFVLGGGYPLTRTPLVHASHYPIEVAEVPSSTLPLVTQMPVELSQLFNPKIIVTQLVIELTTVKGIVSPGGFLVYEA